MTVGVTCGRSIGPTARRRAQMAHWDASRPQRVASTTERARAPTRPRTRVSANAQPVLDEGAIEVPVGRTLPARPEHPESRVLFRGSRPLPGHPISAVPPALRRSRRDVRLPRPIPRGAWSSTASGKCRASRSRSRAVPAVSGLSTGIPDGRIRDFTCPRAAIASDAIRAVSRDKRDEHHERRRPAGTAMVRVRLPGFSRGHWRSGRGCRGSPGWCRHCHWT